MYRVAIFPGRVGFGFLRKNPVGFGSGLPGDFVLNFFRKFAKRCKIFAAFRLFLYSKIVKILVFMLNILYIPIFQQNISIFEKKTDFCTLF